MNNNNNKKKKHGGVPSSRLFAVSSILQTGILETGKSFQSEHIALWWVWFNYMCVSFTDLHLRRHAEHAARAD